MPNQRTREKIRLVTNIRLFAVSLLCLLLWLPGCASTVRASQPGPQQPLVVDTQQRHVICFWVELADNPESRRLGLMHRRHLPDNAGMLFDYRSQQRVQMWMKNTGIPLDMLFIDEDGRIVHIVKNTQPHSTAIIDSAEPVRAVLELKAGSAERHAIRRGDRVRHAVFGNLNQSDCTAGAS